jgi:hypothetical protein
MNMKTATYFTVIAFGIMALSACRKEYKEIGEAPSKIEGITAAWILSSCSVVDKGGFVEETMDITPFFSSTSRLPNISFKMEGNVGRYTCDTSNIAFNFFGGTSGSWQFDNAEFPTKVTLTPDGSTQTIVLPLAATIRPTDAFLRIDKSIQCGGSEKGVYRLTFSRL